MTDTQPDRRRRGAAARSELAAVRAKAMPARHRQRLAHLAASPAAQPLIEHLDRLRATAEAMTTTEETRMSTEQPRMATYVGGPLDGQNAIRTAPKFTRYRDDDGKPLNSARGDHEFVGRPRRPTRWYVHEGTDPDEVGYAGRSFYVHGSVWHDWWAQRLAARRQAARTPVRSSAAATAPARPTGGTR